MIWEIRFPLQWLPIIGLSLFLASCGGCGGKSSGGGGGEAPPPAADGTDDTDDTPTDDGSDDASDGEPEPVIIDESLGEEVEPLEDEVGIIDTSTRAKLVHLPFINSANKDAGKRHLSEFLVVIRAKEESCTRFKIRPTSGVNDEVSDSLIDDELADNGPCEDKIDLGENKPAGDSDTAETDDEEEDGLELRSGKKAEESYYSQFDWIYPNGQGEAAYNRSFALQNSAKELCDARLFRMPNNQDVRFGLPAGLDNVVTKTGRLLHIGSKVRVWLDEEYSNVCVAVDDPETGLDDRDGVRFGPLIQSGALSNDLPQMDKLWYAHIKNIGDEMDKIITNMNANFGEISDIDGTGKIEIFISPEVNRYYLNRTESGNIDQFRARLIFKPEDLAYYDVQSNPSSNEGEVLYLWAPDPAGIYNYVQFPSANSLTSNYAKGFLAAQAMMLVIAQQKLFVHALEEMEDRWLAEALAGIASAYYAGNDYTTDALAQYLTSRSQFVPLVADLNGKHFTDDYLITAIDEQFGMRVIFAWYLHSRLCSGTSVAPCAELKKLITTKKLGVDSLEEILGEKMETTLENFALSVGVTMMERPDRAFAFWENSDNAESLPPKPYLLPELQEIFPDDPRLTQEANKNVATADLVTDNFLDRTVAGPIPNKGALVYQPLTADQDLEFKIADTAVTWVLVTSLVEQTTDATIYFGKGLNVVLIPMGDRDASSRLMVVEKTSENAHIDFRPVNLSQIQGDENTTYRYEPYLRDEDFSVTPDRELWILGSIDNYNVNVQGSAKPAPDADAYAIVWNPCRGLTGDDLVACEAEEHDVLVQAYPRQFKSQLNPLLVVTDTDRKMFRGALALGHFATDRESTYPRLRCPSQRAVVYALCCRWTKERSKPHDQSRL